MRRSLFNTATVASLVLGMAVCALWVRSWGNNWRGDQIGFSIGEDRWELRSQGGRLALCAIEQWFFSGPSTGGKVVPRYNSRAVISIAWWIPLTMTAVLPVIWLIRWKRLRRRVTDGLCLRCGYDLRASNGRCPECGDAIAAG